MPNNGNIKLALADDHTLFRKGLVQILNAYNGIEVVFQASNGKEMMEMLAELDALPDVCLVDINMPVLNGYDTVKLIRKEYPDLRILALSMYDKEVNIIKMLRCGANGYALKDIEPENLVAAIRTLKQHGFYHSDLITKKVLRDSKSEKDTDEVVLTERELSFINHCCTEKTYKEIARVMKLSERTVDGYRDRLFEKMGVRSRTGMVIYAMRNGLVNIY